jgi:hypothetical protein
MQYGKNFMEVINLYFRTVLNIKWTQVPSTLFLIRLLTIWKGLVQSILLKITTRIYGCPCARLVWRGEGMTPVPIHLGSRRKQVTNLRSFHYVGYRTLGGCHSRCGRLQNKKKSFPFPGINPQFLGLLAPVLVIALNKLSWHPVPLKSYVSFICVESNVSTMATLLQFWMVVYLHHSS